MSNMFFSAASGKSHKQRSHMGYLTDLISDCLCGKLEDLVILMLGLRNLVCNIFGQKVRDPAHSPSYLLTFSLVYWLSLAQN